MVELAKGNFTYTREDGLVVVLSWQEQQAFEEYNPEDGYSLGRFFSLVDFAVGVDCGQMATPYDATLQNFDIHFLNRGFNGEVENQFTGTAEIGGTDTKIISQGTVKLLREPNTPLTFTYTISLDTPDGTITQETSGVLPGVYPWGNITFPDLTDENSEPTIYYITPERGFWPDVFTLDLYMLNEQGEVDIFQTMPRQSFLLNLDSNHEKIVIHPDMANQLYSESKHRKEVGIRWVFISNVDEKQYVEQVDKVYTAANAEPYFTNISFSNENPDGHLARMFGRATNGTGELAADVDAGLSYEAHWDNETGAFQFENYLDDTMPLVKNYPGEYGTPAGNLVYDITVRARKGAYINTIKIEQGDQVIEGKAIGWGGKTDDGLYYYYSLGTLGSPPTMTIGTGDFIVTATDSRGLKVSRKIKVKTYDYLSTTCAVQAIQPSIDGKWALDVKGQFHSSTPGADFIPKLECYYKLKGDDTYSSWEVPQEDIITNNNTYSTLIDIGDIVEGTAGEFYVSAYAYTDTWKVLYIRNIEGQIIAQYEPYTVIAEEVWAGHPVESNHERISNLPVFDWSAEDFNFNVPVNVNGDMVVNGFNITEDIEYGSWTPACNCVSNPEEANGYFLRVKDMVIVQFYFQGIVDISIGNDILYFTGLPYDTDSSRWYAGGGNCSNYATREGDSLGLFTGWSIEGDKIYGRTNSGSSTQEIQSYAGGTYRFNRHNSGGYVVGGLTSTGAMLYASGTIAYKCNI